MQLRNIFLLEKIKPKEIKKAFTLVEVIVALFIFVIAMTASVTIFSNMFKAYRESRYLQKDLENAQYAINLMSKIFTTGSVADIAGDGSSVTVFNYSRGECVKYVFENNGLYKYTSGALGLSACEALAFPSSGIAMTSGNVTGKFSAEKSDSTAGNKRVGKVTVSMTLSSGQFTTKIQLTSSLRDYGQSDISI